MWGNGMPSGWRDAWEEIVWPRHSVAWQTVIARDKQSSLRERRGRHTGSPCLQLPAMTLGREPCPAHPRSVQAIKRNTELLIWSGGFLIHHPVMFLELHQGESRLKMGPKRAQQAYLKLMGESGEGKYIVLTASSVQRKTLWEPLRPNDVKNLF